MSTISQKQYVEANLRLEELLNGTSSKLCVIDLFTNS